MLEVCIKKKLAKKSKEKKVKKVGCIFTCSSSNPWSQGGTGQGVREEQDRDRPLEEETHARGVYKKKSKKKISCIFEQDIDRSNEEETHARGVY